MLQGTVWYAWATASSHTGSLAPTCLQTYTLFKDAGVDGTNKLVSAACHLHSWGDVDCVETQLRRTILVQ